MGFYSFYKIIKDIIRTIFGNRVFRLVLIACICGFLLCFVSDKVEATFQDDTNGIFDDTIPITQNTNNFSLGSGNSAINVKLPSLVWNYDNIFVTYSCETSGNSTNVCKIIFSSSNFYYSFSNNFVYYDGNSNSSYYWSAVEIVNGVADFSGKQLSDFVYRQGTSTSPFKPNFTFAGNYENYTALYGKIYQKNTNALILDSSSLVVSYNNDPITFTYNNTTYSNDTFDISEYKYFFIGTNRDGDYFQIYQSKSPINFTISSNYLRTVNVSSIIDLYYYSIPISNFNTYNFNNFDYGTNYNSNFEGSTYQGETHYILSNYNVSIDNYVFNKNSNIYITINPYFQPSDTEIQSLAWDDIFVELGDFNINDNDLYIHRLEVSRTVVGTGAEQTISYYYNDNTIKLKKGDKYWRQLFDLEQYYFSVPMNQFGFKPEKAYFLVLTDNSDSITSSLGKVNENYYNTIFQIVEINSGNLITIDDVINNNVEKMGDDVTFLGRTIEESLSIGSENNKQLSEETNSNINTNLNFNNQNSGLNNLNNGFFSRLTNLIRNLLGYNLSEDTTIYIPYPNSNKNLELHSNIIYSNLSPTFQALISSFWFFVFGFYMWRFINKIYIAVSTGHILDTFSSSGEAITNDML